MTFHSNDYYFVGLEQDLKQPLKKPAVLESDGYSHPVTF